MTTNTHSTQVRDAKTQAIMQNVPDVYEIRDYHYRPDMWDEYVAWTEGATRILTEEFDIVGFWFDSGHAPRQGGATPEEHPLGAPNVTWIIRWDDLEQREAGWERLWDNPSWVNHWEAHPDPDGYLNTSIRFMTSPDRE